MFTISNIMSPSIRDIPDDLIRHIYGYIGDINTSSGIGHVLKAGCFCPSFFRVMYSMDLKHSFIVNCLKMDLPVLIEDLKTLEGVSSLYEDTIIAVNAQRPTINRATLTMLKDTSQRVKSITNRLVDILQYADNRIDAYEISASLKNIRENASNGYLISGLASFKNTYNDTLVSYNNKISTTN